MTTQGHEFHAVRDVKVIGPYSLLLTFEDGFCREVDLSPILHGRRFGPLRDPKLFRQVRLEPEFETIIWPTGADFDPETLYHWDRYLPYMKEMAQKWEQTGVNA